MIRTVLFSVRKEGKTIKIEKLFFLTFFICQYSWRRFCSIFDDVEASVFHLERGILTFYKSSRAPIAFFNFPVLNIIESFVSKHVQSVAN